MINLKNKDSVAAKIEEILQQEALKGQQHQIDKNKNKKIDAQDFAILRGEKKAEVKEAAKPDFLDMDKDGDKKEPMKQAIKQAKMKKEEIEQIDELSKGTLGSYVKSATKDFGASRKLASDFEHNAKSARKPSMKAANTRLADRFKATAMKRHAGIDKAVNRLTKEEVEQMDEREMTKGETAERERIVKGMKKSFSGFRARYGDKAKSVMYATATKQAMKEESEEVKENSPFDWKKPRPPESKGGSGVKAGRAYGGAAQKSKPEQEDEKKKVTESKRPESDTVPFEGPYNSSSSPVITDKSGAKHTPLSRVKHLAKQALKKVEKDLGTK